MLKRIALIVIAITVLVGCSGQAIADDPGPLPAFVLVTPDPNATATPTPFQPIPPTATRHVTLTPTAVPATPTPTITVTPTEIPLPEGTINLMLLGSDWRPEAGGRTDVIILVSINTRKGTVSLVSFPRDLYVTIPGWGQDRINTAKAYGGFAMLQDTMQYNFRVRPTHYISTNFQGFTSIINTLGGINVRVGQTLTDKCDLPQMDSERNCTVEPGTVEMDGDTALWYVRSRYTTSDLDRTRRAQEVLVGMFNKLLSLNAVTRAPELYKQFKNSVETDMGLDDMLPLVPMAPRLKEEGRIRRYTVGPAEVWDYRTETGARVLLPNYEAIWLIIQEAVFSE